MMVMAAEMGSVTINPSIHQSFCSPAFDASNINHSCSMSTKIEPIRISYQALQHNAPTVRTQLEKALGSQEGSLGFVLIDGSATHFLARLED